jgi:hypothetical protein
MDKERLARAWYPFYRTFSLTTWKAKDTNPLANKLIVWLKERLNSLARRKLLLVSINDLKTNNLLVRPTSMPVQDNHQCL